MKIIGKMHIDGAFDGRVNSLDNISIGKSGYVKGLIEAHHLNISGLLEGDIICEEIHIEAGGEVRGTVTSKHMSISEGGIFIGESKKWEQSQVDKLLTDMSVVETMENKLELEAK